MHVLYQSVNIHSTLTMELDDICIFNQSMNLKEAARYVDIHIYPNTPVRIQMYMHSRMSRIHTRVHAQKHVCTHVFAHKHSHILIPIFVYAYSQHYGFRVRQRQWSSAQLRFRPAQNTITRLVRFGGR